MQCRDIPYHAAKKRSDGERLYHDWDVAIPNFLHFAYCCFDILLTVGSSTEP